MSVPLNQLPVAEVTNEAGQTRFVEIEYIHKRNKNVFIDQFSSANSSLGSVFQQNANVDVYLISPSITFAKNIYVQVQVTNNSASSVDLVNAPFLFNYIQVYVGSTTLYQVYPESMFAYYGCYRVEETGLLAAQQNFDPVTYESSVQGIIAAGQTATYLIEIPNVFTQANIPLTFLNNSVRLQFNFSSNILTSTSVENDPSNVVLNQLQVFLTGDRIEASAYGRLEAQLRSGIHRWTAYESDFFVQSLGALANNSTASTTLGSMYGKMALFQFFLRQASAIGEARYQMNNLSLYKLANITLYDQSGAPWQQPSSPEALLRLAVSRDYSPSLFWTVFPQYQFLFSDVKLLSLLEGKISSKFVSNNWRLQFQTPASAGTNCEVVVLSWKQVAIEVDPRGNLTYIVDN